MYAIEFLTKIKNGIIEIPQEYRKRLQQEDADSDIRVILLTKERAPVEQPDTDKDFIEYLLSNPLQVSNFSPLNRDELHARS